MATALHRRLLKELAEIRAAHAASTQKLGCVVIINSKDTDPEDLQRQIAGAEGRHAIIIRFIGPDGGEELGTGCLNEDYNDD